MLKKYLMIFLVSMVPLIELRGAVPIAVGMNLPLLPSYIICILGNMLPVPIIFFFARKVLEWGADKPVIGKFFTFCLEKGHKGGEKLKAKAGRGLPWALLLFVGILLRDINRSPRYRRALERVNRDNEAPLAAREKLMLAITHDIKAPLGSVMGYIDLLSRLTTG